MSASINIALIIGSLRKESINRKFAEYMVSQMPESVTIKEVYIADLPLYNRPLAKVINQARNSQQRRIASF